MPNLFILKFVAKYKKIYARLNDREVVHNFLAIKSTHVSVYFFFCWITNKLTFLWHPMIPLYKHHKIILFFFLAWKILK